MTSPCKECGALCCRYFCFQIDKPDGYDEFEDIRWYLCHQGVSVHIDEDDGWYIQIANPCLKLGAEGLCTTYEDRPLICRKYDTAGCEAIGDDYGYKEEFRTPEQLDAYARRTLGEAKYLRQKVRLRAKAEGVSPQEMARRLAVKLTPAHPGRSRQKMTRKRPARRA